MKKIFFLILGLLLTTAAFTQNQKGFVKTKGRLVNGQLVPGEGLKGATVTIKGRTPVVVKKDDGSFSFPVPEKQFLFDSVRKKGYELIDVDIYGRMFEYSSNPIYIVMETPERQLQDKLDAERKIRKNLNKLLQEKEDEIEAMREENRISMEEYQRALQQLYADQESNEQLISAMAKRYSELDYDQIDEFNRQISTYILNGELTKADSLINSKGDINERLDQLRQHEEANARERENLEKKRRQLEQSEEMARKEKDDLANDCYSKYEIFYIQHKNDTAAYYLMLRAELDTTNVINQNDAAKFFVEFLSEFEKALPYYHTALRQSRIQYGENSAITATIYYNLGMVCYYQGNWQEALDYFNKALGIRLNIFGANRPEVAEMYNSIGLIYTYQGDFKTALEYFFKTLEIREKSYDKDNPEVAMAYNNIGYIYSSKRDYEKALEYQNKSLEIKNKTMNDDDPSIAISHTNIGSIYVFIKDYEKAEYHLNKALEINKKVLGENHPQTSLSYNNIGMLYMNKGDYEKALEYVNKSLEMYRRIFGEKNEKVSSIYINIGTIYGKMNDYEKSLEYFNKALAINKEIFGEEHDNTKVLKIAIELTKKKMNKQ